MTKARKFPIAFLYCLFLLPKLFSLLVPRRNDLIVLGGGGLHIDNVTSVLLAQPKPPAELEIVVVVHPRHWRNPWLAKALNEVPNARAVRLRSFKAAWACLRATWVLVPNGREDVLRFWLGKARLVYLNHGFWIKSMWTQWAPFQRLVDVMFGRFAIVLASHENEVQDYRIWFGKGPQVVCLGYPRSALLDRRQAGKPDGGAVGLYPTWKEFEDRSYDAALARLLWERIVGQGIPASLELRPHALSGIEPVKLGQATSWPGLLVTDFSSMAMDQYYRGGKVLLYSTCTARYVAEVGLRAAMASWVTSHIVDEPERLAGRVVDVLRGVDEGVPPPCSLQPFDARAFWELLVTAGSEGP